MSTARKLVIASIIGVSLALLHYAWARFQAATIIVPISGQVLLDGQPLPHAYVKFAPVPLAGQNPLDTNPGSYAFTDQAGCFTLLQIENDQPGVAWGEHKILMRTGRPGPGPDGYIDERVPFSWRKGVRTFYVSWTRNQQAIFQIETVDRYSPRTQQQNLASDQLTP